jgi:outer membrane protein assembly factor BamE (lipoprotein component of BamABCDE complex)
MRPQRLRQRTQSARHAALGSLLIALSISQIGCVYALMAPSTPPQLPPRAEQAQLRAGLTPAQVRQLLGEPTSVKTRRNGTEHWVYREESGLRGCRVSLLGVTLRQPPKQVTEIAIVFGSSGLELAQVRTKTPQGRHLQDLVPSAARAGTTQSTPGS